MSLPVQTVHFQEHRIRIYNLPDNPVFHQGDLLKILGLTKHQASQHINKELECLTLKNKAIQALNYGGLFRLIFNATQKEKAQAFEKWLLDELIPTLRKYGHPYHPSHN